MAAPPLRRFKPEAPNPAQQKIVENVRNYLFVFLKLCADSRESAKRAPVSLCPPKLARLLLSRRTYPWLASSPPPGCPRPIRA